MNLTYAVRDGIISHCGEIDENCIKPRNDYIDLGTYTYLINIALILGKVVL